MDFSDYIKSLPNERFEVQNKIKKESRWDKSAQYSG